MTDACAVAPLLRLVPVRMAIRAPVLGGCLLVLILAGCTTDESPPPARGEATTGGETSAISPTSRAVATPELPAPVSAADVRSIRLGTLETARLDVDSPDWLAVAAASLWVKLDPGTVVRVDPATARVEKRVPPRGPEEFNLCQGFGSSGDAIWSCTPFGSIERIDASTNRVTDRLLVPMRSDQGHLVVASKRLWIITRSGNSIAGINLEDDKLGEPIPLGASCTDLAAADPIVWAVCPAENQVLRVDTGTGQVTGRLGLPEPRTAAVRDHLWVGFKGGVAQVNPESLSIDAVYDVQPGPGGGIWAGTDRVWVRCDGGPFLIGIDPDARRVVASVTADDLLSGGDVVGVGHQLWATAYDDSTLVRLRLPAS